jgi:DnaJ-class molecular chaperone
MSKDCPECEGTGQVVCGECGNDKDCEDCNGSGTVEDDE